MSLERVTRLQKTIGVLGAAFFIIILLSIVDSLMLQLLRHHFTVHMLPGETVKVNGPMPERIKRISELTAIAQHDSLLVRIERVHTGYWLGGNLWNGYVKALEDLEPGTYKFMVRPIEYEKDEAFPVFTANVHASRARYREHSKSIAYKHLGLKPWWIGLAGLPPAVLCFFLVLRLSRIRERVLMDQGKAEIVRVKKSEDKMEIAFGAGKDQGVYAGESLTLLNEQGEPSGTFTVARVWEKSGVAIVTDSCPVKPGWMVTWKPK